MPRQRPPILLLVPLVFLVLPVACKHDGVVRPADGALREQTVAGERVVEIFTQGADESSPLVVWLHGLGGRPERFAPFWQAFPGKIEIALPQGPLDSQGGFGWFNYEQGMSEDQVAAEIAGAEEKLWPTLVELAHGRKLIVGGFSQGAIMTYVLATRHPGAITYAFPISGGSPSKLWPRGHTPTAPVYAMHGSADPVIRVDFARATIAAFRADGATAELHELAGVGHMFTDEMAADLVVRVRALTAP